VLSIAISVDCCTCEKQLEENVSLLGVCINKRIKAIKMKCFEVFWCSVEREHLPYILKLSA